MYACIYVCMYQLKWPATQEVMGSNLAEDQLTNFSSSFYKT